jgi:hypothetical protein
MTSPPLLFTDQAVNCKHSSLVNKLLEGGADSNICTGPLSLKDDKITFPVDESLFLMSHEYQSDGHRYAPLHVAVQMNDASAAMPLLNATESNVDVRVRSGVGGDANVDVLDALGGRLTSKQLTLSMSTPLHLANNNNDAGALTSALLSKGANPLAQNYQLKLAGAKLSSAQLRFWVWNQAQGRQTLLLLGRKGVPRAVGMIVLQHVVGLHLSAHYANAMEVESSVANAPLFALRLFDDAEWPSKSSEVSRRFVNNYVISDPNSFYHQPSPVLPVFNEQAEDAAFSRLVACKLEKSKRLKTAEFFQRIIKHLQEQDVGSDDDAAPDEKLEPGKEDEGSEVIPPPLSLPPVVSLFLLLSSFLFSRPPLLLHLSSDRCWAGSFPCPLPVYCKLMLG